MKDVLFCFEMPHNGYFGGIANIIRAYLNNAILFERNEVTISLFDYTMKKECKNPRIHNIVYAIYQRRELRRVLASNPDTIVHIHTSIGWLLFKDCLLVRYLKKHLPNKVIMSIHFADYNKVFSHNKLIKKIERHCLTHDVDRIISLSKKFKDELIEHGFQQNKVEVLYTFHNIGQDFVQPKPRDKNNTNLLFIGSFDRRKGILDLLRAMESINSEDVTLHLCGQLTDQSINEEFSSLVKKLGKTVAIHGYVQGEEKKAILQSSDILVLPSYSEGMPVVIMEAFAAGCGIISTKIAAIPEIITDSNGILIEPGDIHALANAIETLVDDSTRLIEMKKCNFEKGKEYGVNKNIMRLCEIYNSCGNAEL